MSDFRNLPSGFPGGGPMPSLRPETFIAIGVVLVVLGVLAWIDAVMATLASVVVLGVLLVVAGIAQLAQVFAHRRVAVQNQWLAALGGLLYILGGLLMIEEPATGSVFLTAFLAGCLIFAGIARAVWISGHRTVGNWWSILLSAIITLLVGILIWATLPWSGLFLIGTLIAIELIIAGVSAVMFGLALRKQA